MEYAVEFLRKSHQHSFKNEKEIRKSKMLGCFYCLKIYPIQDVSEDDFLEEEGTLLCPHCGIDSVIGDASGIELRKDFLESMHKEWFDKTISAEELKVWDKYREKILGIRNYKSDKQEFSVNDFRTIEILEPFIVEALTGESDITPAGKDFIER